MPRKLDAKRADRAVADALRDLVLPGRAPGTSFGDNARRRMDGSVPEPYADFTQRVFDSVRDTTTPVTHAKDVAEAVWRAVTDPRAPMRLPAGADAVARWEANKSEADGH